MGHIVQEGSVALYITCIHQGCVNQLTLHSTAGTELITQTHLNPIYDIFVFFCL